MKGGAVELRALVESDAPVLLAAIEASRPQLKRRMRWPGEVRAASDCAVFISGNPEAFGVFEKDGGALVGVASLQHLSRAPGLGEASVWIAADRRERGYAVEAGRQLIAKGFRDLNLHRLYSRIEPSNRSARKVLRRLGFRYEGCLREEKKLNGRWVDQECWGLLKEEWKR